MAPAAVKSPPLGFPRRCLRSFVRLQGFDRSMVIASQAFTAVIPLLILTSAFLPAGTGLPVSEVIIRRFGLSGQAADAVTLVFANPGADSMGAVSLVLLILSGVTFTRRLQGIYLNAWQVPPRGVRGSLLAVAGLAALLVELTALSLARSLVGAFPLDWAVGLAFSLLVSVALWTSIPWLLLYCSIPWRRLLMTGLLTGGAMSVWGMVTTVYMPVLMESYSERYGLFGVMIALVGWLLSIALIVVVGAVVAAELDRAPEAWARRIRSRPQDADGHGAAFTRGG